MVLNAISLPSCLRVHLIQDPDRLLAGKVVLAEHLKCSVSLPLSNWKVFVNNRNAEEDRMQSRSVDEHLHNMVKTPQKFFNIFFLQLLAFFASRFRYVLPNTKKGFDWKVWYISFLGLSHRLNHKVRGLETWKLGQINIMLGRTGSRHGFPRPTPL